MIFRPWLAVVLAALWMQFAVAADESAALAIAAVSGSSSVAEPAAASGKSNNNEPAAEVFPSATTPAAALQLPALPEITSATTSAPSPLLPVELTRPAESTPPLDLTAVQDDLWERIRQGFSMPDLDNKLVTRHERWYGNQPEYLRRVVQRSRLYLHHIVETLEKRGMPTELALLPIVESSYNPLAISTARASGLWQFIPSTGRIYKLDQDWWVDERRDILASTEAALNYLQYIYEMHGDWQLALASYNWGEGAVKRAKAKNQAKGKPTDYSSLKMPRETQNYVPKLQALKNIINDRALWTSLEIPAIPNRPYFSQINKPADMDVRMAARFAEMPIDEFRALNPAHNRPVIKADIPIILPSDKVDLFFTNYTQNSDPLVSWHSYTFQKTDRIEKLAARSGMSLANFKAVNGIHAKRGRVVPGQTLLLPSAELMASNEPLDTFAPPPAPEKKWRRTTRGGKKVASSSRPVPAASKSDAGSNSKATRYKVRKGDTVTSIARRHNVSPRAITQNNSGKTSIRAGQTLLIGGGS